MCMWSKGQRKLTSMDQHQYFPCDTCPMIFPSEIDAERHMWAENHYRVRCSVCHQRFKTKRALDSHLTSGSHRTFTTLCAFCGCAFPKASVLMSHLESGICPYAPGLNHHSILWILRNCDDIGIIVNLQPAWLTTGRLAFANPEIENGFTCFTCFRSFKSPLLLQAHLQYPMDHPEKRNPRVYRCRLGRGECDKSFVSLTDLFKHLEAQTCGAMSFDAVQHMTNCLTDVFWGCGVWAPWQ